MKWISPTKNQNIISKQKMRDINPNISYPNIEAKQQTPTHCSKNHPIQSLHHNDKQQTGQRVPFSQATRTTKKTGGKYNELPMSTVFPQNRNSSTCTSENPSSIFQRTPDSPILFYYQGIRWQ
jgi:hypothetical protein